MVYGMDGTERSLKLANISLNTNPDLKEKALASPKSASLRTPLFVIRILAVFISLCRIWGDDYDKRFEYPEMIPYLRKC